uniref:V-type proton ATPase proteolipid subunit n=1 Tax=Haptolina ericina TaxID=156174 RepID=A0A7S3ADR3_9EUKA|mmetsp:Transcript_13523/g.30709  ORF Transcript_13523/g.30709 Transcript_13523/m.30709 type:complete len:211 (+) Transcript_13523:49-681(+)
MDDDLAAEHSTHGHGSSFEFAAVTVAKAISASSFSTSSHLDPLELCPPWAPALGFGGAAAALVFASIGSAIGTGKAGMGISSIGVQNPEIVMKNIIPVVMAGVLGIYGLIVAVIIGNEVKPFSTGKGEFSDYSVFTGYAHLAAGLCCGLSGLAAGLVIGIVGDAAVRAVAMQPRVYVGMVLILIFAEALGLYGLIVALILTSNVSNDCLT